RDRLARLRSARMHDAAMRMASLPPQVGLEVHAQLDEVGDPRGRLAGQGLHRALAAKAAPGTVRVLGMDARVVARADRRGDAALQVLLWERALEPFAGTWSLPGGDLLEGETLAESIRRHLATKVDVRELTHLEQLETRSDPGRNPVRWELATAFLGLVPSDV